MGKKSKTNRRPSRAANAPQSPTSPSEDAKDADTEAKTLEVPASGSSASSSDSIPTSAALTANEDVPQAPAAPSPAPPAPPPPPPQPPIQVFPPLKGSPRRLVRRNSTSQPEAVNGDINFGESQNGRLHGRSAIEPSSVSASASADGFTSTSDLPSTIANSNSSSDRPWGKAKSNSNLAAHSSPAQEFMSALKRSNTIDSPASFSPSSLKKSRAAAASRLREAEVANGDGDATGNGNSSPDSNISPNSTSEETSTTATSASTDAGAVADSGVDTIGNAIAKEGSGAIITKENADATTNTNANEPSESPTQDSNTEKPKRPSFSPPPVKPKPESLSVNRKNSAKGKPGLERGASGSGSDLLRSVVLKEATQVAQNGGNGTGVNGRPPVPSTSSTSASSTSTIASPSSPAPSSAPKTDRITASASSTPPATPARNPSRPPRTTGSVQKLAASFEGRIQLSAPPLPGTPMTLRNRTSIGSAKTLKSVKSSSSVVGGRGGEDAPNGEDITNTSNEGERDAVDTSEASEETNEEHGRERERERMLSIATPVPPVGYDAVVADFVRKSRGSKSTLELEAVDIDVGAGAGECFPPASVVAPAPAPGPGPGPGARPASPPPKNSHGTSAALAKEALAKAKARRPSGDNKVLDSSATGSEQAATAMSSEEREKEKESSSSPSVPLSPSQNEKKGEELKHHGADSPAQAEVPAASAPAVDIDANNTVEGSTPGAEAAKKPTARRLSTLPPSRPPPPVPEAEAEADGEDRKEVEVGAMNASKNGEEITGETSSIARTHTVTEEADGLASPVPPTVTAKPGKRYTVPPPSRQPPPPPVDDGDDGQKDVKVPSPIPEVDENEIAVVRGADGRQGRILSGVVFQEPEDMDENTSDLEQERDMKVNVHVQEVLVRTGGEYDSAEDSSEDEDEDQYENYRTALSRNGSSSLPPTPPTKHDSSFPRMHLTSKWSRNTSATQSPNASASTLALHERLKIQEQLRAELLKVEQETEVDNDNDNNNDHDHDHDAGANDNDYNESVVEEGTTLAHANFNDINDLKDSKNVESGGETEDLMESRFKFPPVSAFPPPAPLPFKRPVANNANRNLKVFRMRNESETSLVSGCESGDDADRDTIMETDGRRFRKKSKSKAKLTSAIAAALAKGPLPPLDGLILGSDQQQAEPITVARSEIVSTASRSSSEETNPMMTQMKARYAKIDALELPRPAPFPTFGDGNQGQSQSTPEEPTSRRPGAGAGSDDRRTVRLSSKLHPITGPQRMNTSPSTITAWGKHKAVMSSETVGTIGTIATEPGDVETSQFGRLNGAAASQVHAHMIGSSPPPPSSFFHRMMSDASRRGPPARRQTTSSQASRLVEDLPVPPFLKRSISPDSGHQRSVTVSFSSRAGTGSISPSHGHGGPATRKNSIVPELRAATIEAAERPLSAVDGDFVLVEEPEEFDIPRAEWDLPLIPSGSLRMPSSMDLNTKFREMDRMNGKEMRPSRGPSSAPATTSPSMPMAPLMQYSRSETMGTMATAVSNDSSNTCASAPAAPAPIAQQTSSGSDASPNGRLSSNELLDLWGRVGVYMSDAAALLHDKSRRVLVGDGTFPGFVLAVARQVPTACIPSRTARYPYGHLIYFQTAGTVHKRCAEIMPGDVIVLQNALFKGVRGPLHQSYQEELGSKGDPVVGVIGEHEPKKCKVRVYQANQHVGIQTVEYVSYRFPDLKSGTIKLFRVPDS